MEFPSIPPSGRTMSLAHSFQKTRSVGHQETTQQGERRLRQLEPTSELPFPLYGLETNHPIEFREQNYCHKI